MTGRAILYAPCLSDTNIGSPVLRYQPGSPDIPRKPKRPLYPRSADMTQEPIYSIALYHCYIITPCLSWSFPLLHVLRATNFGF
jgi:hypothetical protein